MFRRRNFGATHCLSSSSSSTTCFQATPLLRVRRPLAAEPLLLSGAINSSQARYPTHAFMRTPMYHLIPGHSPNGQAVKRENLMYQFRELFNKLQTSRLVDKVHVMSERGSGGLDPVKCADQLAAIGSTFLAMPLEGNETRISEWMESMRYVRGAGGPSTLTSTLQDADDCRCHSGDIVHVPNGVVVGHGPRTNEGAVEAIKDHFEFSEQFSKFEVLPIEQEGDAPPLGDYFGFAGSNTLIAWKDEHGMLAVDQYQTARGIETSSSSSSSSSSSAKDVDDESEGNEDGKSAEGAEKGEGEEGEETLGAATNAGDTSIVYLEPGCHFLTFFGRDENVIDVLVQRGHDRSIEALAQAGLNPIPVSWSEMDKLGISMRSAVLMMDFAKNADKQRLSGVLPRSSKPTRRNMRWKAHRELPPGGE